MNTPATDTKVSANLGSKITLSNLLGGRIENQFSHYVSAVLRGIRDTDTPALRVRKKDDARAAEWAQLCPRHRATVLQLLR